METLRQCTVSIRRADMNHIVIFKNEGTYQVSNQNSHSPCVFYLANFLLEEAYSKDTFMVEELLNPSSIGLVGNYVVCALYGDAVVLTDEDHADDPRADTGAFMTTRSVLLKIIDDWLAIRKDPQYNVIIIRMDGDKVTFEGRLEEHPYKKFLKEEKITKIKMDYIILVKNDGFYFQINTAIVNPILLNLSNFLTYDVSQSTTSKINELAETKKTTGICLKSVYISNREKSFVLEYREDGLTEKPDPHPFVTTKENLIKIIEDWLTIKKDPRYNVIIIRMGGDKVTFEGRLEEHPYKKFLKGEKITKI